MEKVNLNLDDAPLIVAAVYPNADMKVTWLKRTSFIAADLPSKVRGKYEDKMEWILRQYHALQKQDDLRSIAPHVLPYSAKVGLALRVTKEELKSSVRKLQTVPTEYTKQLAVSLHNSLENSRMDETKPVTQAVDGAITHERRRVRLVDATPLNEFSLITSDVYDMSSLSWHDLAEDTDELPFDQKQRQLQRLLASNHSQLQMNYRFEIVAEPQVIRELAEKVPPLKLYSQPPTPAHGYNIPKVNDGGMIERCFDLSYELYSELQAVRPEAAPLVCLYGHRQRYLVECGGTALPKIYDRELKLSPPAINIVKFMRKAISLKHQTIHTWFEDKEKSKKVKRGASSSKD